MRLGLLHKMQIRQLHEELKDNTRVCKTGSKINIFSELKILG